MSSDVGQESRKVLPFSEAARTLHLGALEQELDRQVASLGNEAVSRDYGLIKARQQGAYLEKVERLEQGRAEAVETVAEALLEKRWQEAHPALKPRFGLGSEEKEVHRALEDAQSYVLHQENRELDGLRSTFREVRLRFVEDAVDRALRRQTFNAQSAKGAIARERSQERRKR
ncbi:MAG: hypothetical protein AAF191_08505 [Verrucomicrobiota bacterium]